jgi:DNA-binding NarL/FixJ family response regulator
MIMEHIRVVLADDHPIVRSSIRSILNKSPDIEVIGEASNGAEALMLVGSLDPDVLVLDVEMPEVHGIDVAQKLQEEKAELPILAVSAHEDRQFILGMLSSGAAGYLSKAEVPDMIVRAIRSVAHGQQGWVSRRVAARLAIWLQLDKESRHRLPQEDILLLHMFLADKTPEEMSQLTQLSGKEIDQRLEQAVLAIRHILKDTLH